MINKCHLWAEAQSIAYFRNEYDTDNNSNDNFDNNHDIYDNDDNKKGTIIIMTIMIIASVIWWWQQYKIKKHKALPRWCSSCRMLTEQTCRNHLWW